MAEPDPDPAQATRVASPSRLGDVAMAGLAALAVALTGIVAWGAGLALDLPSALDAGRLLGVLAPAVLLAGLGLALARLRSRRRRPGA